MDFMAPAHSTGEAIQPFKTSDTSVSIIKKILKYILVLHYSQSLFFVL